MASSSEQLPPGRMVPQVPLGTEIPPEPPEVGARTLAEASRLLAGASAFFFVAFLFAYFYLRSLNVEHMWRPAHVNPDQALGGAMIGCVVVSAALAFLGERQMKRGSPKWLLTVSGALALGLAAVALQCVEYTVQHFGPTNGAYASVFCIWTAFYLVAVLGAMYWLETDVATELRARRRPAPREGDIAEADRLIAPGLDAGVFYWAFLAAIGVITYVTLYLL
jgi:heme/copper-type cytochrome/quinol oxidase subunit 3